MIAFNILLTLLLLIGMTFLVVKWAVHLSCGHDYELIDCAYKFDKSGKPSGYNMVYQCKKCKSLKILKVRY